MKVLRRFTDMCVLSACYVGAMRCAVNQRINYTVLRLNSISQIPDGLWLCEDRSFLEQKKLPFNLLRPMAEYLPTNPALLCSVCFCWCFLCQRGVIHVVTFPLVDPCCTHVQHENYARLTHRIGKGALRSCCVEDGPTEGPGDPREIQSRNHGRERYRLTGLNR